jgi:predicted RNA-binding Zn-ribbon protein involved in translation (DUF1610 family)
MSWANLRRGEHNHVCPECGDLWKCGSRTCQASEVHICPGCHFEELVLDLKDDTKTTE